MATRKPIGRGAKFGRWTVLHEVGAAGRQGAIYRVRCSCGLERDIHGTVLRAGRSLGCRLCARIKRRITIGKKHGAGISKSLQRRGIKRHVDSGTDYATDFLNDD